MLLTIQAQPNAKATEVVGWVTEDTVKIKVGAPAKQGKANLELIGWLAKRLGVTKSEIELVHGQTSRLKLVKVPLNKSELHKKLTS